MYNVGRPGWFCWRSCPNVYCRKKRVVNADRSTTRERPLVAYSVEKLASEVSIITAIFSVRVL